MIYDTPLHDALQALTVVSAMPMHDQSTLRQDVVTHLLTIIMQKTSELYEDGKTLQTPMVDARGEIAAEWKAKFDGIHTGQVPADAVKDNVSFGPVTDRPLVPRQAKD